MTHRIFNISLIFLILYTLISCEEKEMIKFDPDNVTTSELTVPATITLTPDNESDVVKFSWSEADYGIPVSITYILQVDTSNSFPAPYNLYSGGSLSYETNVKDFNTKLLNNLGLEPEVETPVFFRVATSVNNNIDQYISTSKSKEITTYPTEFPPIYMIGAATGGWDTQLAVEMLSTKPKIYSTIAKFKSNEAFRFFAQPDWGPTSYNYPYFDKDSISVLLENANDGDQNFKFTGDSGYYRITVSMKTLSVKMDAVDEPVMYMTGAAIGGWDQPGTGKSVKMTFVKENVWTGTADFVNGEAFRFFAQPDWGPTSYNYPYFSDGTVDPLLEDAGDGDNNFKFTGSSGTYKVTLNLQELTVDLEAQ